MMSYTVSATWSHPVSSPCYTEHGQRYGDILSGRITTIAMFRSGQLRQHCTVELNYSGMSARLAGASVTHDHVLDTYEPNCVPGVRGNTGALLSGRRGQSHMAASEPTSAGR
jgi:hypothetical protein